MPASQYLGLNPRQTGHSRGSTLTNRHARAYGVATTVVVAAMVLTACGGSKTDDDESSGAGGGAESCVDTSGDTIKLGFLNSTSGAMAISEQTVRDSLTLAAEEINAGGGVMGKSIEFVEEDGASDPAIFAEKIQNCLLYTSPSPRDGLLSRMPSSA